MKLRNPEQHCRSLIIIMAIENILVHRLALIRIFCTYSLIVYFICCHVVAYELDVNKAISARDYEKTSCTFVTSNGWTSKMIKVLIIEIMRNIPFNFIVYSC